MLVYPSSRSMSRARRRMRAPVVLGFFLNGGSPARRPRHAGPTCCRCGGAVVTGWSLAYRGPACTSCGAPAQAALTTEFPTRQGRHADGCAREMTPIPAGMWEAS